MKITKTRLKEIIREELLREGRDRLIKKQIINTPLGDLIFDVWEVVTGPGEPSMITYGVDFKGEGRVVPLYEGTIEGALGGEGKVKHEPIARKVRLNKR